MGLDMNLYRKHYYGGRYRKQTEELQKEGRNIDLEGHTLKVSGKFAEENGIDVNNITYITEEVMYWRKANQIHDWFDRNCRRNDYGIENCEPVYVEASDLRELLSACHQVIADPSKAEELLPTSSGFFYGSTEYDEYYFDELKRTIETLEPILEKYPDAEFEYSAWW